MISAIRNCFIVVAFVIVSMGIAQGSPSDPLDIQMMIDAIEDAGQYAGQDAYLRFVDEQGNVYSFITPPAVRWPSASDVYYFSGENGTLKDKGWLLQSGGNIWSSDNIVGDALEKLNAGVYRISPVTGAFTYDSFDWSDVYDKWLWQLQIYAIGAIEGNEIKNVNYTLGSALLYDGNDGPAQALQASLLVYKDITLAEGGKLIFWIADGSLTGKPFERNTIDNAGGLTFNITEIPPAVPEPSTLILIGTGLLVLVRRIRGALVPLN